MSVTIPHKHNLLTLIMLSKKLMEVKYMKQHLKHVRNWRNFANVDKTTVFSQQILHKINKKKINNFI